MDTLVKSQQPILELTSSLTEFTLRSGDENDSWVIDNRFGGDNDVKLVTDEIDCLWVTS